jgi:hypothetical protein
MILSLWQLVGKAIGGPFSAFMAVGAASIITAKNIAR